MAKQSKSQSNQSGVSRYVFFLIFGIFVGRQWTLLTVDPHGVIPNDNTNFYEQEQQPKLQDPSIRTNKRIRRDLEAAVPTLANPLQSNPSAIKTTPPPIQQELLQDQNPTPASVPKDATKGESLVADPPRETAQEQDDENDKDDGESDNDNSDNNNDKDQDADEDKKNDEEADEEEVPTLKVSNTDNNSIIPTTTTNNNNNPISLETMAPKLKVDPPIITLPNNGIFQTTTTSNINTTVDISKFQAEIDRRLPLWKQEALKEDDLQDPPNVQIYNGVVLATKVHYVGRDSVNQMICLQKAAYNYRRNYPWVIFHTVPVTPKQAAEARALAYPGTVTFVQDSPPLEEVVGNFSKEEQDYLINRCQCCHPKDSKNCCKNPEKRIDWGWWCFEKKTGWVTLSYAWQAVFRSYEIWTHPALKDYKYMVWIDDDAIPTKAWLKDPLKPMVEEDLVIFYDNFPAGFCKSGGIIEKMELAYNHSYCYIHRITKFKGPQTGIFVVRPCKVNKKGNKVLDKFGLVHGMMHITNLDIYRKPIHLNFQRILTQHNTHPFSREWDDQIAVTVPAAFENPEKAWDMRMHGFNMSIHHNGKLDGKNKNKRWKYTTWWKYHKDEFPVAREMCDHLVKFGG